MPIASVFVLVVGAEGGAETGYPAGVEFGELVVLGTANDVPMASVLVLVAVAPVLDEVTLVAEASTELSVPEEIAMDEDTASVLVLTATDEEATELEGMLELPMVLLAEAETSVLAVETGETEESAVANTLEVATLDTGMLDETAELSDEPELGATLD